VEYAIEAISHAGSAVGILSKEGVVLAAEKKILSKARARRRTRCSARAARPRPPSCWRSWRGAPAGRLRCGGWRSRAARRAAPLRVRATRQP
jgi:hypothetical protein